MIELQCPAVSTALGAISVPVQRKPLAMTTSETEGYSPGAASEPPTMAIEGEAENASAAAVAATSVESLREKVMRAATQPARRNLRPRRE